MSKTKMKPAVIPKFSRESEEAAWWDAHRSEIEAEIRQRVKQKRPLTLRSLLQGEKPSQPITLRILKEDLEAARRLAARKGMGYQTYIKMLLRESLADASERVATEINGRAAKMTCEERAQADSETKKIADRVRRRTH
jgi:predicted DNA binding CopG/RHH family protein